MSLREGSHSVSWLFLSSVPSPPTNLKNGHYSLRTVSLCFGVGEGAEACSKSEDRFELSRESGFGKPKEYPPGST